jgi:hypothetical protein
MKPVQSLITVALCLSVSVSLAAAAPAQDKPQKAQKQGQGQGRGGGGGGGGGGRNAATPAPADVQALKSLSVMLGRPTDKSIVVSVLSSEDRQCYVEYGIEPGKLVRQTKPVSLKAGEPAEILLEGLAAGTRYYYKVADREGSFRTQARPGTTFTFEIQGDSHPERAKQHDPALYAQTLRAAAADKPDFYMTIGDDFSVDTLKSITAETVRGVYVNQRSYLSLVGQSSPVFLVNGNHEQAAMYNLDGKAENVAVWAQNSRNTYFPQPAPDAFYTGDQQKVEHIGLLRDYYAWTWGDALFVVIDPYWHSTQPVDNVFGGGPKARDMWAITLGDAQYHWLKQTLESSKAKYKFVFTHHVLGTGRGGIEEAGLFEWGGADRRGINQFAARRPTWDKPIHKLMADAGVTIFFQGHDHVFVHQELDGVVYQTLPEPADPTYTLYFADTYTSGDKLPNSGRVRVTVSPANVKVEYVRSWLPKDATAEHPDGEVAFSYTVAGRSARAGKP